MVLNKKKLLFGFVILLVIVLIIIIVFNNHSSEPVVKGFIVNNSSNVYSEPMTESEYNFIVQQQACEENCTSMECVQECYLN